MGCSLRDSLQGPELLFHSTHRTASSFPSHLLLGQATKATRKLHRSSSSNSLRVSNPQKFCKSLTFRYLPFAGLAGLVGLFAGSVSLRLRIVAVKQLSKSTKGLPDWQVACSQPAIALILLDLVAYNRRAPHCDFLRISIPRSLCNLYYCGKSVPFVGKPPIPCFHALIPDSRNCHESSCMQKGRFRTSGIAPFYFIPYCRAISPRSVNPFTKNCMASATSSRPIIRTRMRMPLSPRNRLTRSAPDRIQ